MRTPDNAQPCSDERAEGQEKGRVINPHPSGVPRVYGRIPSFGTPDAVAVSCMTPLLSYSGAPRTVSNSVSPETGPTRPVSSRLAVSA